MDTHGMKFVVDTTGVAKGFRDYRAAVDGIFKSLSQFEAHVDKTMKGVAKASSNPQALNAFKKSVQAFSKIDIDTGAAKKLSALSSAMGGFKAPSQSQSANAKKFFTTLGSIPDLTNAYRSVKSLSNLGATLSGFKAPSQSQSKNLAAFGAAGLKAAPGLNALGGIKNLSAAAAGISTISGAMKGLRAPSAGQIANVQALAHAMRQFNFKNLGGSGNFYAALGAIGAFRAPSQAQIRNLQQFVTAVGNMRVPPHATQVAAALQQIATAASHAGSALGGLRAGLGGLGGSLGRVGSHAQGAKLQMMGLQNAFSGTFQIGSALRSLLGSLTIAELGRNFFEATNKVLQFKAQMGILSKTTGFADLQLQYIRETANRFGVSLESTMEGFGKVSIAANKAGMTVMQTRHVFEGFSSAMTVLGTSVAGQGDVWLALQQVMNKGYLSAEELNQQLNEKLPGAMAYATEYAEKMGTTLEKGLKEKALDASGVLEHIATRMKQDFGPAMVDALMRPAAQFTILKNNITELFQEVGQGKAAAGIANLLKSMASLFDPRDTSGFADSLGTAIADAANKAAQAINWLKANWDSLKGPISTALDLMGKWMILSAGMQIGRTLITPLIQLQGALQGFGKTMSGITGQQGSLARGFGTLTAGVRPLNSGLAGLGRVGVMLAGNFSLLSSTSRVASLGLVGLNGAANVARVGLAGLRAAGSAVAGFFGGPWGVALMAAATAVGYLVNQYYDMKAAFASTQPTLDSVNEVMMSMGLRAIEGAKNTKELAREQELGKTKVDNFAGAVGGLAQNLYNAAVQARQMRRELLEGNLTKLQGQREALTGGDGFWANVGRGAKEMMTFGGYSQQVLKDLKPIDAAIARQREELNALPKDAKGLEALVTPAMREIYGGTPTPRKPTPTEDKGGASKAAREALTLANSIDSLMKKLAESNDLWKLSQGYVADLTDEARALLTDGSFKQWSQNLQADFKAGKVSADSLIKSLEQPGAISQKALTEIKNRYGMDVQDIIQMLRAQQADYEDAVKDATIKQIDRQLVYLDRAMNRLSANSPAIKLNIDFASDMQAGAKELLSKDQFVGFADTLRGLRAGTVSAEAATAEFNTRLLASADISKLTKEQLDALTAATNRNLAALNYQKAQAAENATFGATKLRQMREENALLLLNERQQGIYSDVLEEVRTRLAAGETVSREQVQSYIQQREALGGLNDQLQRNKEFFENNGIRSYLNDLKSVGEAANELDKNVLQSLEDQLFNLGTKGKFSFKAIFDTIQQGLIRASSQKITEGITKMFTSKEDRENGTASPMGKLFEMIGLGKYEPKQAAPLGSSATSPMYVKLIDGLNLTTGQQNAINPTTGLPNGQAVSGTDPASTIVNAAASLMGGTSAGTTTSTTGSSTPPPAVTEAATQTAQTFGSSLTSLMPAIGASFSSAFNGPIAGISQMFAQMLAQQMTGGTGGGMGSTLGAVGGMLGSTLGKAIGGKTGAAIGGALGTIAGTVGGAYLGGFKEGGIVGSPVTKSFATPSMFVNAPHYKEGTANTSGGIPAVLHDNEAVIPLSRGRKVPVDLGGAAKKGTQVNQVFNIQTPDANSFRKSDQQIASNMHAQAARAYRRNN